VNELTAFLLGMSAGLFLALVVLLVLALQATRRRQEQLDELIRGGRR
jgi:formate/nitrite transporter FocA (FNT family)